jgi:1,4-alpha-glucan branching enzyme
MVDEFELGELDEYLLAEGTHRRLWQVLGAHEVEGGVRFAVWAPNASAVSVVGEFSLWAAEAYPMTRRGSTGIWQAFVPGIGEGAAYKYEIRDRDGAKLPQKADPVGFGSEHPPATASIVRRLGTYAWQDASWDARRAGAADQPVSVYEVHPISSTRHSSSSTPLTWASHTSR